MQNFSLAVGELGELVRRAAAAGFSLRPITEEKCFPVVFCQGIERNGTRPKEDCVNLMSLPFPMGHAQHPCSVYA